MNLSKWKIFAICASICILLILIVICIPSIRNELFYRFCHYGWYSSSKEDYINNNYLKYDFTGEINKFIPKYDDIKSKAKVLDFEFSDSFYGLPEKIAHKGNCWCSLTLAYDDDAYEKIKNYILSLKDIKFYERRDFDGYQIPSENEFWKELDFCDELKVVRYFYLHNVEPKSIRDLALGSDVFTWETKKTHKTGDGSMS